MPVAKLVCAGRWCLSAARRMGSAAQQMLADAMAQSFGLVEKIDFDNLKFETDDE